MGAIVRTTYRYKRPPKKRKAVALEVLAIVRAGKKARSSAIKGLISANLAEMKADALTGYDDRKSAIVTIRRRGKRFADVPDMTPEEHKRRGDGADAMFQEMKRQIAAAKERP
jgi:hypothetical protein